MARKEAPLSPSRLAFFSQAKPLSISKAAVELDYAPHIRFEEGMHEAVRWYKDSGCL